MSHPTATVPKPTLPDSDQPAVRRRGRPRKDNSSESVAQTSKRGRPKKEPSEAKHTKNVQRQNHNPKTPQQHWEYAKTLQHNISNHYAMKPSEQELAFYAALTLPKKSRIIELGVTHAHTAITLCYACRLTNSTYTGIDNFSTEGSYEEAVANLANSNQKNTILKTNSHELSWEKPVDYILFDAGHDHYNMRLDVEFWLPKLKPGGLALFHDYNPKIDYEDPHFPVKHYANMYSSNWEEVAYIPFLLIRRKPA